MTIHNLTMILKVHGGDASEMEQQLIQTLARSAAKSISAVVFDLTKLRPSDGPQPLEIFLVAAVEEEKCDQLYQQLRNFFILYLVDRQYKMVSRRCDAGTDDDSSGAGPRRIRFAVKIGGHPEEDIEALRIRFAQRMNKTLLGKFKVIKRLALMPYPNNNTWITLDLEVPRLYCDEVSKSALATLASMFPAVWDYYDNDVHMSRRCQRFID